jgi:hypothetical protein
VIALLLVAFADLVAPGGSARPATGELTVSLELPAGGYRIVHTWRGAKPMRFVTGASDRNCEDPIDVLLVDDKPVALYSELPCGGFAFRSVRTIAPGGSWTIEGHTSVNGAHEVHAQYAASADDLKSIDPKERDKKQPPFWFGRVVSSGLLVDEVIRATRGSQRPLDSAAFADLKNVDATSLRAGERVELGRVIKPALRDNPHALVRLLIESGQIQTFVHVESQLRFAEEQNGAERYRARLAGHHTYFTNQENRSPIRFDVELDKRSGLITVVGAP